MTIVSSFLLYFLCKTWAPSCIHSSSGSYPLYCEYYGYS